MKFLIDECLSPELAEVARAEGHAGSTHVNWLGLTSAKDWTIARRAVDEGFVFVTNNTADFAALYGREALHVGLVCLNVRAGGLNLELQRRLFRQVLSELDGEEIYNEVLEITLDKDGFVSIERYSHPE
ncbi:MAG TPA: DUF5615 family PIN-like protein [Caulobacteraceae bacterium]|nr:DUF5615 family PIN-like protein [Caulobacteraceae bacterium]